MKVAASFVVYVECKACRTLETYGGPCEHADFLRVSVEAEVGWDAKLCEPEFVGHPVVTGWEGDGRAPRWHELDNREQGYAYDALSDSMDYAALQREARPPFAAEGVSP